MNTLPSTPTLILTPRHTEDAQQLWQAAVRRGWRVERLVGWRVPEHLRAVAEPVLYLDALLAPSLAPAFGVSLCEPPDDWLPRLPAAYRRRTVRLTTLGEARNGPFPAFVKPPNDKSFPARAYAEGDLPAEFAAETPVLVAEIVTWEREFRCFILDRALQTFSIYLRDGELQRQHNFVSTPEEDAELRAYVSELLADPAVELPRAAALDVGVIAGRGWAVVELNSAWGAGIYGCDPDVVLDVLRHAVQRQGGA